MRMEKLMRKTVHNLDLDRLEKAYCKAKETENENQINKRLLELVENNLEKFKKIK